MKSLDEKRYGLEKSKTILLAIGAISTFMAFFLPFINDRERQMNIAFSESLARLGDDNPAIRAGAAIELVQYYNYHRYFGFGEAPYQELTVFVLQNSLKKNGEEVFVRQAVLQALMQIDANALEGAWLKDVDLSNLNIRNINFNHSYLVNADLSGSTSQEYKEGDTPASFENVNFFRANLSGVEFWDANFKFVRFEEANLSGSYFIQGTDLSEAIFLRANLSNTDFYEMNIPVNLEKAYFEQTNLNNTDFSNTLLNEAVFKNITTWNDMTNFSGAKCNGTMFDENSEFYQWGRNNFPNCFK